MKVGERCWRSCIDSSSRVRRSEGHAAAVHVLPVPINIPSDGLARSNHLRLQRALPAIRLAIASWVVFVRVDARQGDRAVGRVELQVALVCGRERHRRLRVRRPSVECEHQVERGGGDLRHEAPVGGLCLDAEVAPAAGGRAKVDDSFEGAGNVRQLLSFSSDTLSAYLLLVCMVSSLVSLLSLALSAACTLIAPLLVRRSSESTAL